MTRVLLRQLLLAWLALLIVGCVVVHQWTRIAPAPMPSEEAAQWALAVLEAARAGETVPDLIADADSYHAAGPIFVLAWHRGRVLARHVGEGSLAGTVRDAAIAFAEDSSVRRLGAWGVPDVSDPMRFTLTFTLGEGPLLWRLPYIGNLGVVPLREGMHVRVGDRHAWISPEELRAERLYDRGVPLPIPDMSFGVDVERLVDRLARQMGRDVEAVRDEGEVTRFLAETIGTETYPANGVRADEDTLRRAATEGARFLIRHQRADGSYTYLYDPQHGGARPAGYNMPRHAGTTYFLAQVHNLADVPEARGAARRALHWVLRHHVQRCGGPERWCVESYGQVDMGSSALTALAAAEFLSGGEDAHVRELLEGLTAFIRAQQREDGEFMHEYDLGNQQPVDVQHMYYSGEAALALFRAHEVSGDERNLDAARKVMAHLTGAGWDFLGSRYYYGEEHWTCMAAAKAAEHMDAEGALDFCRRWAAFNREIQYQVEETPWPIAGAYGVGPLFLPRLTPVASRSEAFISTYEMGLGAGIDDRAIRAQVERGLELLLRYRLAPGPTHLLADPVQSQGGIPMSPADLHVRNDFVQHACSAMIRWADHLRRERLHPNSVP